MKIETNTEDIIQIQDVPVSGMISYFLNDDGSISDFDFPRIARTIVYANGRVVTVPVTRGCTCDIYCFDDGGTFYRFLPDVCLEDIKEMCDLAYAETKNYKALKEFVAQCNHNNVFVHWDVLDYLEELKKKENEDT